MSNKFTKEMQKKLKGYSMSNGLIRDNKIFYLIMHKDEIFDFYDHTLDFQINNGEYYSQFMEWTCISECLITHPETTCIRLGPNGEVKTVLNSVCLEERIEGVDRIGFLREINAVDGKAYAVGVGRQVYRRDDVNTWIRLDKGASFPENEMGASFDSVAGFSENEIYFAGWNGDLFKFNGKDFIKIDLGITRSFYKIRTSSDGFLYLAGHDGMVFRGRNDKWERLENSDSYSIWDMCEFNGKMYFSSNKYVYELNDNQLSRIDFGYKKEITCFHLTAKDGLMWSIGSKDLLEFNGSKWERILKL